MALCVQDMLEVGMVEEPLNSPELLWNRAHFGGWAVSSSPLVIVTRTHHLSSGLRCVPEWSQA